VSVGLGTNFGIVEWGDGFIGLIGSASQVDGKVEKETPDAEAERSGSVQWAAIQDKYFLSVLIPRQGSAVYVKKEGEKLVSTSVRMPVSASGSILDFKLYAGPKEYDTLRALQIGLEDTIDFGWFIFGSWTVVKAVAKPIFYVLRFLNDYTHNYGVTIVLLTVAIKMLFVPLQFKSYKSMKQMQVIQPKVLALQEKFKDDRDRLNKELIKLYRDHKVNPVGGCLPMVLQMPVFVALFNILYMTIDLRQAPFMLWIRDLSVQDPYYVLPLIMGATMVIQQKITPTTMDPAQAKIMLILPVFMTFLFVNFPAGLVLYWLTNNVLTIGQQIVTDRYIFKHRPVLAGREESTSRV
jgi:YidC/Oxa1 family membrane protein insertase